MEAQPAFHPSSSSCLVSEPSSHGQLVIVNRDLGHMIEDVQGPAVSICEECLSEQDPV